MTKTALITLLTIAVGLEAPSASAQDTAEEMASACKSVASAEVSGEGVKVPSTFEAGVCWGAFLSLQDVIVVGDVRGRALLGVCAPAKSTRTQLVAVFLRYTETHPEKLHRPFVETALASLRQAFPCRETR